MIVYKKWYGLNGLERTQVCDGWFLFGIIPLYIRKVRTHE